MPRRVRRVRYDHGMRKGPSDIDPATLVDRAWVAPWIRLDEFEIDRTMRQVPTHFHAHARDPRWWAERMSRPMSRYTGVGGERVTR